MSTLKINYKVDRITRSEVESKVYIFLFQSIQENSYRDDKKLVSISIRMSHRPIPGKRQEYVILFTTNIDVDNFNPSEVKAQIETRLSNRKIDIKDIISFHLHLFYV